MKRLTKKQISVIAKVHSSLHLRGTQLYMFEDDCELLYEDQVKVIDEIHTISDKIAGRLPTDLGSTQAIIEYAIKNH